MRLGDETIIYALATGAGRAAIAVVRLSGPGIGPLLTRLCGTCPPPRRASLRRLAARDGTVLDQALVLYFPGPGSFTGEDSAELHLHGSHAVLRAVGMALSALGARPAEAGEFSRRAYLNGRMDLLAAEGLADLIAAETEAQRLAAMRQMQGAAGALASAWRARLLEASAGQEALIDFPDEEVPSDEPAFQAELLGLAEEMAMAVEASRGADRLRDGVVVAVVGAPNVGKSALVNALAKRDVAIVSAAPGTTRDAIEVALELDGLPVLLVDTAGLRDSDDPVEREGVHRARRRAAEADIVLAVAEAGQVAPVDANGGRVLQVVSKIDLTPAPAGLLGVSALTGEGLDRVRNMLTGRARAVVSGSGTPVLTRERHRASVLMCRERIAAALTARAPELRAEELRLALDEIGRLTGAAHAEEVLDVVFSRFCIGK